VCVQLGILENNGRSLLCITTVVHDDENGMVQVNFKKWVYSLL